MKEELIKIKKALGKVLFNFSEAQASDGTVLVWDGDLVEGTLVYVFDENGDKQPAPNGKYMIDMVGEVEVVDGIVKAIVVPEQAQEPTVEASSVVEDNPKVKELETKVDELKALVSQLFSVVEKLGETPVATPATKKKGEGLQEPAPVVTKKVPQVEESKAKNFFKQ